METIIQPSRRFNKKDLEYEEPETELVEYFVYPNFRKEMVDHKIPVVPDMQDVGLTNFMTRVADPENIEKKVSAMVRLQFVNSIEPNKGKRTEYLIWYENWEGEDKNGNIIAPVNDLPQGVDKTVKFSRQLDSQGREHYKIQRENWFYSIPFKPELVDQILKETNTEPDKVAYTAQGVESWGGFSYEEFTKCSFEELNKRGRTGEVQQPVPTSGEVVAELMNIKGKSRGKK